MKNILLVLALFFLAIIANAQSTLKHPFKIYKAPDGKLYVQKSLPIYFYLSTEPNQKGTMYQLQSDSTKAFANPMYLDTEGYNTFRSPSAVDTVTKEIVYPLTDVIFEMYADGMVPKTVMKMDASKKYFDGKIEFIGSGLMVELSSSDSESGVEQILVSIDSGAFVTYSKPIALDKEKTYSIQYYAVDNVGNAEPIKAKNYTLDLSAPITELTFNGEKFEHVISGRTQLILTSSDPISGLNSVYFSMDGKNFQKYYHPLSASIWAEGEHTIYYYAEDKVGNKEVEKEYKFYIDKTAPILVDEIMGNSFVVNGREYSSGRTKLKLTAVDNKAGVKEIKYSVNNEEFQLYDKPFYLTTISGSLAVSSYAIDNVGNKSIASEKSTRSRASYVDLTGPQLKYDFTGKVFKTRDTTFVNKDTKIVLSAMDPESGLKVLSYSLNNGSEITYQKPFNIPDEGAYSLSIYGYDNVDNSNRESINLVVDNAGPEIFARFSILPISKKEVKGSLVDVYSSQAVLFLSATDSKVAIDRIYYTIKGETEKMFTGIIDGFKRGREYEIEVKALDKLGNINRDTIVFITDNTGPEVFTRFSIHPIGKETIDGKEVDIYPSHVSLFLSVSNATGVYDKIYYSVNGGKELIYQGIIDGFKPETFVKMKIRALDRLGNETDTEIAFKISE